MSKQILSKLPYSKTSESASKDFVEYKMKYLTYSELANLNDVLTGPGKENKIKKEKAKLDQFSVQDEINPYYSTLLRGPKRTFNQRSKELLGTIPEFVLD
jgi:hypothetical protein